MPEFSPAKSPTFIFLFCWRFCIALLVPLLFLLWAKVEAVILLGFPSTSFYMSPGSAAVFWTLNLVAILCELH